MPANLAKAVPVVIETLGSNAQGFSFALEQFEGRTQLRALHRPDYGPIYADWLSADLRRRITAGRKQLISRAIGLNKTTKLRILDATAGLGRDGFLLAALGAQVTMAERNPQVYSLLADAHGRALLDPKFADAANRVTLRNSEGLAAAGTEPWEVIYLDPMYAGTGRTALPQKEMQILRDLTGGDRDADQLITGAMGCGCKRIVVKRPAKAAWLGAIKPSQTFLGTQARFDVYLAS